MQRKITWAIACSILCLAGAIVGVHYLRPSNNQIAPSEKGQGDKDFLDFISQKKKLPQAGGEVSLVAVGDIMLSRTVASKIKAHNDTNYPFLKVADFISDADIAFGNLENPITDGPAIAPYEMNLRANPGVEQALKNSGFDILSLANNHTPNFGAQGLADTLDYLDKAGIAHAGAGRNSEEANQPIYIVRKGTAFAFLSYNDADVVPPYYEAAEKWAGTAFMRSEKIVEAVKSARQKADFVIVSLHSGDEYSGKPNESQTNCAHKAIDAGAELVIGHHPHVIQPIEKYNGKYIFYSLGNFIFDQMQSDGTRRGLAIKIFFDKGGVQRISLFPLLIQDYSQPEFLKGDETGKALGTLGYSLSDGLVFEWDYAPSQFKKFARKMIYAGPFSRENISKSETADVGNDGKPEEFILRDGTLEIIQEGKAIWESPKEWWVDDFILADSNNDGIADINLSVWKSGDFGASKPFWIRENDMSVKNHFFVFDLAGGSMEPIWQSSNLDVPNCEFQVADVDGDGKNDLITIEGEYSKKPKCDGKYVAVWKWNGWGFSNEWRSDMGKFGNLEVERIGGKAQIAVREL